MKSNKIRMAIIRQDVVKLLGICAPYLKKTTFVFDYKVPTLLNLKKRIGLGVGKISLFDCGKGTFQIMPTLECSRSASVPLIRGNDDVHGKIISMQNIMNLNVCVAYPKSEASSLSRNGVRFHNYLEYQCTRKFPSMRLPVWLLVPDVADGKNFGSSQRTPYPKYNTLIKC